LVLPVCPQAPSFSPNTYGRGRRLAWGLASFQVMQMWVQSLVTLGNDFTSWVSDVSWITDTTETLYQLPSYQRGLHGTWSIVPLGGWLGCICYFAYDLLQNNTQNYSMPRLLYLQNGNTGRLYYISLFSGTNDNVCVECSTGCQSRDYSIMNVRC
jgi:hypothetical protein